MNDDSIFRLIAASIFVPALAVGVYHRRRAARAGDKISRRGEGTALMVALRLVGFSTWVAVIAYIINPEWIEWSSLELSAWLRWAGAGLGVAAVPMLYWVMSSLGKNLTDTVALRKEHTLITGGPYRWVRHPFYLVALLFLLALTLMSASWLIGALGALTFAMLAIRTPIEEAKLVERFGDEYRAYMQRTGRFVPRLFTGTR